MTSDHDDSAPPFQTSTSAEVFAATIRWLVGDRGRSALSGCIDATEPGIWADLLRIADGHRLLGLVSHAVEFGDLPHPVDGLTELAQLHHDRMEQCLLIERSLVRAVEALQRQGITPLVLKGVATAHLDYPDPGIRTFNDADIHVRPDDIAQAVEVLIECGGRRDLPPRTRHWDTRFAKDIALLDRFDVEIDLHRTLVRGVFGAWMDPCDLHLGPEAFRLAGTTVHAPCAPGRVLHAAVALTIAEASPRLAHVVDLCLALRKVDRAATVEQFADRWKATGVLGEAVDFVTSTLGTEPVAADGSVLRGGDLYQPDERRARQMYRSHGGTNAAELLGALRAIPGLRLRADYLRGLVLPSRAYRVARRRAGRSREWSTGARELIRQRRGARIRS